MNEVKDICDAALESPAPPLREASTALAMARGSTRRRHLVTASAAAAVAVVAAAIVVAPRLLASPAQATSRGAQAAESSAPPALPAAPTWQQAQENGQRVADTLIAAVPAGYTGAAEWNSTDGQTSIWLYADGTKNPHPSPGPTSQYISMSNIVVSKDGHEGLLTSILRRDDVTASTADLCSAEVTERLSPTLSGATDNCQVALVNGVPVRTSTGHVADLGDVVVAVRMLDNGFLAVQASEGTWDFTTVDHDLPPDATHPAISSHEPALISLFMTSAQVAALAADPALLP